MTKRIITGIFVTLMCGHLIFLVINDDPVARIINIVSAGVWLAFIIAIWPSNQRKGE